MTAEIISVGTELLLGGTVNSDAQIVSEKLSELGINVYYHTVVGDNDARLMDAVRIAANRADIIITTGGLGPTYDDMTKETLAKAFGKPLVLYPEEEARVRAWFSGAGFSFTENNLRQAYFPEGSEILANPIGTAPGCAFHSDLGGKRIAVIMLPGPPRECRKMMYEQAAPFLKKLAGMGEIVSRTLFIFGMGESAVEDKLRDYMRSLTNPTLAPYAKPGEVQLRVTAKADTHALAEEMIAPVIERVQSVLGDAVYGVDIGSLENCVLKLLRERGKTLCAAESVTGGLIAKRITDISGCSDVFRGSAVTYSDRAKIELLGVAPETIAEHTAVSEQTVIEMAAGALSKFDADYAIAVTGFAEGEGNTFIAAAERSSGKDTFNFRFDTREIPLGFDRERSRAMAAHMAFDMLRRMILAGG
ncbi:MAG: competence/damage-inducible protein A [Oscillospiraceae bacterium]|jgi:nicotinamide-nucleotide amidase|nr:competence/damage-inducible protein A [Oscillospiraceae bacterium]